MRIATWNVERPRPNGRTIPQAQLRCMGAVDADIWVLTETHLHHQPSTEHTHVMFSPAYQERRPDPERWTAIWSRWPLVAVTDPAAHRRGTVAAIVACPSGDMIVYGTVIAYAGEPAENGDPAAGGKSTSARSRARALSGRSCAPRTRSFRLPSPATSTKTATARDGTAQRMSVRVLEPRSSSRASLA